MMKLKISIVVLGISLILGSCAEEFSVPKLTCNQPDLKVNRTVEEVRAADEDCGAGRSVVWRLCAAA